MLSSLTLRRHLIDEAASGVAAAGAGAALVVEIGWLVRVEPGSAIQVAACVALGAVALLAPLPSLPPTTRIIGFAALAVSFPTTVLAIAPDHARRTPVERIAGIDAVATSVALSEEAFDRASGAVLLPTSSAAHLVSAAALASDVDGPLLLTGSSDVRSDVIAELERLGAARVHVLGRIAPHVLDRLRHLDLDVRTISGSQSAVAAAVAQRRIGGTWLVADLGATDRRLSRQVTEALVRGRPLVHGDEHGLPLASTDALRGGRPERIIAPTPSAVLREHVEIAVGSTLIHPAFAADPVERRELWVAAADRPLDAAVAAAAAAHAGADLRLIGKPGVPSRRGADTVHVVGGTAAVSEEVMQQLAR